MSYHSRPSGPPPPPPSRSPYNDAHYSRPSMSRHDHHRRRSRSPGRPNGAGMNPPGRHSEGDRYGHHHSSGSHEHGMRHRDRQYDNRHDEAHHDRRRRHDDHPRRSLPTQPGQPNINVVLRSLPDKANERDIQATLESMEASIDEVTVIRDRETGESRKFAFVRFTSVGHAIQFVEKHFPHFYIGHQRVRVDYCNKENTKEGHHEWRCPECNKFNDESRRVCVECRLPFESARAQTRAKETETIAINDGSNDVSRTASRMLLLRKLDNLSSEESILHAMRDFEGVLRVLLIKDKLTKMSCEFAFVEFSHPQLAAEAMAKMGDNFSVDRAKPSVSFANPDSFVPIYGMSQWAVKADVPDGLWVYRDDQAYACEYSFAIERERAERAEQERREQEERKAQEEQRLKEAAKKEAEKEKAESSLDDELNAFYADMGDAFSDDKDIEADIFSVPKH